MKKDDIALAVSILTQENRPKVSFHVPVTDNYSNAPDIVIHDCNAGTVGRLIAAGFHLSMSEKAKGLIVDKF